MGIPQFSIPIPIPILIPILALLFAIAVLFAFLPESWRARRGRRERARVLAELASREPPWNILGTMGNGIGGTPASLRSIPTLTEE